MTFYFFAHIIIRETRQKKEAGEGYTTENKIAFIGGDERMLFAAKEFEKDGFTISACGFDKANIDMNTENDAKKALLGAEYIVLPIPFSRDGENITAPLSNKPIPLCEVLSAAKDGAYIFGGMMSEKLLARERTADYYKREEFAILNAVPTAEGAIKLAIEETKSSVCGMDIGITGFGKVGKVLAKTLVSLGANVTVFARSAKDRAWAKAFFCRARKISALCEHIGEFDCIFNTVPSNIIGERELLHLNTEAVMIELASTPYGVDMDSAKKLGVKVRLAPSLPGKEEPKTAGKIIFEIIRDMIEEEK